MQAAPPTHFIITLFLYIHLSRWLEQDPIELLESVRLCIGGVADSLRLEDTPISSIHGVGITNQRETTILWDRLTGVPFYNAIGEHIVVGTASILLLLLYNILCSLER